MSRIIHVFWIALAVVAAVVNADSGRTQTPAASAQDAPTREEFDKGCAEVRDLAKTRKWKQVRDRWTALLARHEGHDYARAKRVTIEDDMKQASFWTTHKEPEPNTLVSADLQVFDRAVDAIRLRYDPKSTKIAAKLATRPKLSIPDLSGLLGGKPEDMKTGDGVFADFAALGHALLHPLEFSGDYSVEVRGVYEGRALLLYFVVDPRDCYYALVNDAPPKLLHWQYGMKKAEEFAHGANVKLERGKKFALTASVSATQIVLRLDGKTALEAKRAKKGGFGWIGIDARSGFESLVLSGKSYGEWIDALIDAAMQKERVEFDKEWDPKKVLPAWLFERVQTSGPAPEIVEANAAIEHGIAPADWKVVNGLLQKQKFDECLTFLDSLPATDAAAPSLAALRAQCFIELDRLSESLTELERVYAALPAEINSRMLRVFLYSVLKSPADAITEARKLVAEFPGELRPYESLSNLLLRERKLDEANGVLESALAQGLTDKGLERFAHQLTRAIKGPEWRATQRFQSKHYEICSDMDRDTCSQVAVVLEESYEYSQKAFGTHLAEEEKRMRAFVFSGRQGYFDYCGDLVGDRKEWTDGMFTPSLQQLLLWNVPSREQMLSTARHEGFHQFLDRLDAHVPTWLNEGLAQYFETLRREKGAFVIGMAAADIAALKSLKVWPELDQLFALRPKDFYANPKVHYAVSRVLVQYLMQGEPKLRPIMDDLLKRLANGEEGAQAVKAAFQGVDLAKLREDLKAYVTSS